MTTCYVPSNSTLRVSCLVLGQVEARGHLGCEHNGRTDALTKTTALSASLSCGLQVSPLSPLQSLVLVLMGRMRDSQWIYAQPDLILFSSSPPLSSQTEGCYLFQIDYDSDSDGEDMEHWELKKYYNVFIVFIFFGIHRITSWSHGNW